MELTPIFLELRFSLIELSYHVSYIRGRCKSCSANRYNLVDLSSHANLCKDLLINFCVSRDVGRDSLIFIRKLCPSEFIRTVSEKKFSIY